MPAAVEVMATTPTSQSAMDSASNADKKRNKLGYHRTSVACGEYLNLHFSSHGLSKARRLYRLCCLFPLPHRDTSMRLPQGALRFVPELEAYSSCTL